MPLHPVCLIDIVGLTPRHLGPDTPHLCKLAATGAALPLAGVLPAVTCTAQASLLTGELPSRHGIVANGWLYRDTMEVRFWQQSNRLIQAETLYAAARRLAAARGEHFTCAKLFWWFNQGAPVDWSLTPKPHYGSDGSKAFGIHGTPEGFSEEMEQELGAFPFFSFWGPKAGLPSTEWITLAATQTMLTKRPTLTLVYLPHLDYDLQRFGPDVPGVARCLREVDDCVGLILDAAKQTGATPIVVSEYGLMPVRRTVLLNRALRQSGWLAVRDGPFGEVLDTFNSQAFAVCDHQAAHVYVSEPGLVPRVAETIAALDGVERVLVGAQRAAAGLDHERAGEIVAFSARDAWFAYPYWLDDRRAPDFARTVEIHRKPGYDPMELFLDPHASGVRARAGLRLVQKTLGLRYRMDVIGLDPSPVRGSHGTDPADAMDGPVLIAPQHALAQPGLRMTGVKDLALRCLGLADGRSTA